MGMRANTKVSVTRRPMTHVGPQALLRHVAASPLLRVTKLTDVGVAPGRPNAMLRVRRKHVRSRPPGGRTLADGHQIIADGARQTFARFSDGDLSG